jgi:hypothetical protein
MHFSDEGYFETLVAKKKAGQRYDTQGHPLLQKENEKQIIFEARIARGGRVRTFLSTSTSTSTALLRLKYEFLKWLLRKT